VTYQFTIDFEDEGDARLALDALSATHDLVLDPERPAVRALGPIMLDGTRVEVEDAIRGDEVATGARPSAHIFNVEAPSWYTTNGVGRRFDHMFASTGLDPRGASTAMRPSSGGSAIMPRSSPSRVSAQDVAPRQCV
jgi:hypothetical protein